MTQTATITEQPSPAVTWVARWAGMPASDVNGLALSLGAVLIGIMTRRAMAATRNENSPKLWIELVLLPVQVIIALVAQRGAGATGIMSTIIAVSVGYGGARLVGSFLTSSGERLVPRSSVLPVNTPAPEIYEALAKVEAADAQKNAA